MTAPVNICRTKFLIEVIYGFWPTIDERKVTITQNSSTTPAQVPVQKLVREIHCMTGKLDLSRFCAAPLITHRAAKEMNHGHNQDG